MRIRRKVFECDGHQMPADDGQRAGSPDWLINAFLDGRIRYMEDGTFMVKTREGPLLGKVGDWVIRGKEGELWPVAKDIFPNSYEVVE